MNNSAPRIAPRANIIEDVTAAIGDALVEARDAVGEVSLTVARDSIVEICTLLRDRFEYQQLMEIAGLAFDGDFAQLDSQSG